VLPNLVHFLPKGRRDKRCWLLGAGEEDIDVAVAPFHFGFEALVFGLEEKGLFLALSQPKFKPSIFVLQGLYVLETGNTGRSSGGGERWD